MGVSLGASHKLLTWLIGWLQNRWSFEQGGKWWYVRRPRRWRPVLIVPGYEEWIGVGMLERDDELVRR